MVTKGQKSIVAALAVTLMMFGCGVNEAFAEDDTQACKDCVIEIQTESCYNDEYGYNCDGIKDALKDYAKSGELGKRGVKFKVEGDDTVYGSD
ncbi:MAG: hypothetical protein WC043_08255 [Pseudobdellovibrionaceae bacterium]